MLLLAEKVVLIFLKTLNNRILLSSMVLITFSGQSSEVNVIICYDIRPQSADRMGNFEVIAFLHDSLYYSFASCGITNIFVLLFLS